MLVRMTRCFAGLVLLLGFGAGSLGTAHAQGSKSKTAKKIIKATVEGELKAQGEASGSKNDPDMPVSFAASRVTGEDGSELTELAGKVFSIKKGKKRDELLKKHKPGDKLTLTGKLDAGKALLQLESFKGAGSGSK
ncbi:MAG: hypothetical protein L0312_00485 [Acidobacteria bacterium]|nr:hypothetical protein [Acidobacteriota bacterium]